MLLPNRHYQPFWIWPAAFGGITTVVGLFWLLNRIIERFFPARQKRYTAGMGNALLGAGALLEPSREHILEVRNYQQVDQDDEGEPPRRMADIKLIAVHPRAFEKHDV